jgi:FMN phosphatase YigB (HAD superfamily)
MLRVVFVDVGGTLWPNAWRALSGDDELRTERLARAVPALSLGAARRIVGELSVADHPADERQATDAVIGHVFRRLAADIHAPVPSVIEAMCLPAPGRAVPFPGAGELLEGAAAVARVVVVSNVLWRDGDAQRRDFDSLGLAPFVTDYVTSLDVGWRKPNPAFFDAALRAGGHPATECALIGDSEANDIVPAVERGMFAVRVALEEPLPAQSAAEYVSESLYEVRDVLLGRIESR